EAFGAPWPGYIGRLPLENAPASEPGWPTFYAERRVLPFVRRATDRGALAASDRRAVERALDRLPALAGGSADEPPRRTHGDLWSGNLVWDRRGTAWLVDPAAHGGHRETDLAMLALFGAPHLGRILAAYDEHVALADGWRERVGLHQLHPLLVHAALFGGGYGARAGAAARRPAPDDPAG
ncbi:MAG: fructosamine kinase family protein, partial [Acidimicrobiales bacterium]